jgi:starch phosphorylase
MAFTFKHPYTVSSKYAIPTAYFCMEYAIHQALKLYAGGLGYLAGSYMRSAFDLKQNVVGVGILWKYGYYSQGRKKDGTMEVQFQKKNYTFLEDTHIKYTIRIAGHDVWVTAYYLPPETFGTAPLFFLTTDLPENDYLAKTTSHKLYDSNPEAAIAAAILLGIGGARLFEHLDWTPEVSHLNESHGLPLAFYLYSRFRDKQEVSKRLVFTNHTPEAGGNPKTNIWRLNNMGFFGDVSEAEVRNIAQTGGDTLDHTLSALRLSKIANGVSNAHVKTLSDIWRGYGDICPIIPITNAQSYSYWADKEMYEALSNNDMETLQRLKKKAKRSLFEVVADQTGKIFKEDVFTLVFARRFAGYKRADLLLFDTDRFKKIINDERYPIQIIWAGKPYPMDYSAIGMFDKIVHHCWELKNCAVLTGYELWLSKLLKDGADAWLNVPRITREASGTSGMSAAMNGTINISIPDGWFPEFGKDKVNSFILRPAEGMPDDHQRDTIESANLYNLLENEVIPLYYRDRHGWQSLIVNGMKDIVPYFDSNRMNDEYYEKLYKYNRTNSYQG